MAILKVPSYPLSCTRGLPKVTNALRPKAHTELTRIQLCSIMSGTVANEVNSGEDSIGANFGLMSGCIIIQEPSLGG